MTKRRDLVRRVFRRLATILLSLIALAVLIEIGLRLFTDLGISLTVRDTSMGKRYRAGFSGALFMPECGRKVHVRINRDGYRGPNRPYAKPAGVRRCAVLGDSWTVALGVDEQDTMAARIERRLGRNWEVLNYGISSYSTAQSLQTWRHVARRYQPDLVLLLFSVRNDVTDNCRRTTNAPRPYFDLDEAGELVLRPMSGIRVFFSRLLSHSRVYNWQKHLFAKARRKVQRLSDHIATDNQVLNREPPPDVAYAWRVTEALLVTLRNEVEASGAKFVLVTVPYSPQYDDGAWAWFKRTAGKLSTDTFDRNHPEERFAAITQRHGFRWIPLLPGFREERKHRELNFGHGHWNEAGNHLAATIVLKQLKAFGLTG